MATVNAAGQYGRWHYAVAYKLEEVRQRLKETMARRREEGPLSGPLPTQSQKEATAEAETT